MNTLTNLFLAYIIQQQYGVPANIVFKVLEVLNNSQDLQSLNNDLIKIENHEINDIKRFTIDRAFKCIEDIVDLAIEGDKNLSDKEKERQKCGNKATSDEIKSLLLKYLEENNVNII